MSDEAQLYFTLAQAKSADLKHEFISAYLAAHPTHDQNAADMAYFLVWMPARRGRDSFLPRWGGTRFCYAPPLARA